MILLIVIAAALGIFLFSIDRSWSNVVSSDRNDLVFEGRNQEYGAFALRKEHHRNMFYALLIAVGIIGGGLLSISALRKKPEYRPSPPNMDITVLIDIPTPDIKKPVEDQPAVKRTVASKPAGGISNIVEVVTTPVAQPSPIVETPGGGGDDPVGIVEPYVPPGGGDGGNGTGGTVVDPVISRVAVVMPEFPGGAKALMEYMAARVRYSDTDVERGTEGTIYVSFVVDQYGNVQDVIIERGIRNGENLARRAKEVILAMPAWSPGNNGQGPVPVRFTMPLKFELKK